MRAPPRLEPGDRVRIIAPSGPVDRERFLCGLAHLEAWGLRPEFAEGVFAQDGYLAGSDARRRAELAAALADPGVRALWLARGGYGAARLLPALELRQIAARPRWLVGFSDATALHALWQCAGLQSLHAANLTTLADWTAGAREQLSSWLFTGQLASCRRRACTTTLPGTVLCGRGSVRGPLLGGNLTVFAALAGTAYLPPLAGAIVFFEDIDERPYRLDRCLTQLCQAGAFERVAGFVIGQLTNCIDRPEQDYGRSALEAMLAVLEPLGVPILGQVPVGHERSSWPVPLGAEAELDLAAGELRF